MCHGYSRFYFTNAFIFPITLSNLKEVIYFLLFWNNQMGQSYPKLWKCSIKKKKKNLLNNSLTYLAGKIPISCRTNCSYLSPRWKVETNYYLMAVLCFNFSLWPHYLWWVSKQFFKSPLLLFETRTMSCWFLLIECKQRQLGNRETCCWKCSLLNNRSLTRFLD